VRNICISGKKVYNFCINIDVKAHMFKLFWVGEEVAKKVVVNTEETAFEMPLWEPLEKQEIGQIALDVLENHESVYILAPVAGIELKDIDISVHETTLTISWIRNKPKEFYEHDMQVKNQECFWGKFLRNVILSENMDFSAVKAVMENNLLVIHIPKIRFDSKNIKINRVEW